MQRLLFRNAFIVNSNRIFTGDLLAENGKITALGRGLPDRDAHVIDANGKYLLPGGVDPHTHFDLDVGFTRASDNFYTGTIAAAFGGTTTVIDHMAFGPPGCRLTHQAEVYHNLAARSVVDYGFHGVFQHVDDDVLLDMARLKADGITSLKLYLTYRPNMLSDPDALSVLVRAKELGLVICAHCENDAIVSHLRAELKQAEKTQARFHPVSRPPEAEAEAVYRFLSLAKAAGEPQVYVVHLSSKAGLMALAALREAGQRNIFAETCPQYLYLDDSRYDDDAEGLKYIMCPPLRKQQDLDALWAGLASTDIDVIGTDHCPFFFQTQKQRGAADFTLCPTGAPGVELRMSLLFSECLQGRMPLPRMVRLCCTSPAVIFGLGDRKGDIVPGLDADLVLFDPTASWVVTQSRLHENVDYTPYEGMQLTGRPVMTVSQGEIIVENGIFTGSPGRGRYLKRH